MERRVFHYQVEMELTDLLRAAPAVERPRLCRQLYDELFRRVPDHPQNRLAGDPHDLERQRCRLIAIQRRFPAPYLTPEAIVVELGAGDAGLANAIAPAVRGAYAIEISEVVLGGRHEGRSNIVPVIYDGIALPIRSNSADVVFSYQLIEHLRPDDACRLLREAARVLKPDGALLCVTPNRADSPHDLASVRSRGARPSSEGIFVRRAFGTDARGGFPRYPLAAQTRPALRALSHRSSDRLLTDAARATAAAGPTAGRQPPDPVSPAALHLRD